MESEIEPYVLEGSCCTSHHVPFLSRYLCNLYFFVPFHVSCIRDFDNTNKDESLDQLDVFVKLPASLLRIDFS